mmetsp:Transcript_41942/g.135715  ORF Transcript_41942/g.135715 Transcript_41942/m.135715 type:complete len:235 (+) Transcript_41942:89-793(+)
MAETRVQNARLTVRNTFLVWEDEDIDAQAARSCRRAFSTCPNMGRAVSFLCEDEPDAEISRSGFTEPTPRDTPVGFAMAAQETDDVAVQGRLSDRRHTRGSRRGCCSQATALRGKSDGPELGQVSDVRRTAPSRQEESEDRTQINANQRIVAAQGQRQGPRGKRQPQQAHEQNSARMVWSRSGAGHANAVGPSSTSGSQNLGSAGILRGRRSLFSTMRTRTAGCGATCTSVQRC